MFNLTQKKIVVTGAAQGNGEAIAKSLAALGATVIVADMNFEKLQNDIKNQQEQVRIAVEYKNCCLKKLEEEISKLKTIEQLKEKKIEEYKTDLLQTEQKELDEIGLQIFKRNVR